MAKYKVIAIDNSNLTTWVVEDNLTLKDAEFYISHNSGSLFIEKEELSLKEIRRLKLERLSGTNL